MQIFSTNKKAKNGKRRDHKAKKLYLLTCKVSRYCLLVTCKVSRYCLLALHGRLAPEWFYLLYCRPNIFFNIFARKISIEFIYFYLLRFAKYTVYIALINDNKKIVMIILLAGTWHQICDIYARPVP